MPIQTDYSFNHASRMKGLAQYLTASNDYTGYAATEIQFGVGLVYAGAASGGRMRVKLPSATGEVFIGVAVADPTKQPTGNPPGLTTLVSTQIASYLTGDAISYRRKGVIIVYSETAVNPSLPVFLRHTANASLLPGDFRTDADTSRADSLPRARWLEVTAASGLTLLELDY